MSIYDEKYQLPSLNEQYLNSFSMDNSFDYEEDNLFQDMWKKLDFNDLYYFIIHKELISDNRSTAEGSILITDIKKDNKLFNKNILTKKRSKPLSKGKRHDKNYCDNIQTKIQVHSINFIKNLINEALKAEGFEEKFIDIKYEFKKKISKKYFSDLKLKNIGDIFKNEISRKFRKIHKSNKTENNAIYEKVIKNEKIKNLLSETYLSIIRNIYLKDKREINMYGLNFALSDKVETFKDFLKNKVGDENDEYRKNIDKVIEKLYLPKNRFIQK